MRIPSLLLFTSSLAASLTSAQVTVLTHATLIDGTGAPPIPDATVVMNNGRIQDIGPAAKVKTPAGAQTVDLTGKFVMPGIINAHGHISDDPLTKIRHYAQYGVTTVIGMGGDGEEQLRIRDEQRRANVYGSALKGARILTVQQRFEFEKDAPSPDAGRRAVDVLAQKKADAVKIVVDARRNTQKKLPAPITAAIIEQAHKDKLKVFAHIHDQEDAERVIDQGVDMLAHIVRDKEVDDAFLLKMKSHRVPMTATLVAALSFFVYADSPAWLDDPFLTRVYDAKRIEIAKTQLKETQSKNKDQALDRRDFEIAQKNFQKMVQAGVRIALGTDSGPTPHRFEGYFEHMEMELMVKNGMTPMQVITAFSKTNSEALGINKDYGTLAKGKIADLVVLDRNPAENILNTRTINAVYMGGRKFE